MDAIVSGLGTAASAMDAQSERLAVLANNLANVAAAGFKAEHLSFVQLLTSPRAAGSESPADPAAPLPVRSQSRTRTDFSPGTMRETGNPLDVALETRGFFVVGSATDPRLTRAGTFMRGRDGALVTPAAGRSSFPIAARSRSTTRAPSTWTAPRWPSSGSSTFRAPRC